MDVPVAAVRRHLVHTANDHACSCAILMTLVHAGVHRLREDAVQGKHHGAPQVRRSRDGTQLSCARDLAMLKDFEGRHSKGQAPRRFENLSD